MRLTLIASQYVSGYGPMRQAAGTYFPLGLGYIAAFVRQRGVEVQFIDPNVEDLPTEALVRRVAGFGPDLVGISFMTPQFRWVQETVAALKRDVPARPCVVGGSHPSALPERTLAEIPEADFVALGEGEETTLELLEQLCAGKGQLADILGLCWRDGERVVRNASRQPIQELDGLPHPARDLIDQSLYGAQSFLSYSKRSMAIHTSRGCPARCVYCASGHRLRSPVRFRSVDNVLEEVQLLRRQYGIDYLLIKDDTFTWKKPRVREFCTAFRQQHPGLKWHCMGRVTAADEDLLAEMKAAGLNDIFFGIESGNDEILKKAGKGATTTLARRAVENCARLGINTYGAFILGLPGDTRETIEQTIEFACSLPLTMAGFSILIPYPGTKVFDDYYLPSETAPIDYDSFIASTGVHYVEGYTGLEGGLSLAELPELVSRAQRRFYLRPRRVVRLLRAATPSMLVGYGKGALALVQKELYLRRKGAA